MKFISVIFLLSLSYQIFSGFSAGTLIQTPYGFLPIEDVQMGDYRPYGTFLRSQEIYACHFVPVVISLSWLFGGGVEFLGATCGVATLGTIIGLSIDTQKNGPHIFIKSEDSTDILYADDAQAPGKPTENDGYEPPKNWDGKKVKHKRGWGYPDKKGSIWIPTGPGDRAHGGPHWDVQHKNGDYDNVMPGGHIRGRKNK